MNAHVAIGNPRPERILVRSVNWLGDAVMTMPALNRLREARPQAHITLLTHEKLRDLWTNNPDLDVILTFSAREGLNAVTRRLRQENLDVAVILPNSPRSALEAWLARVPQRIGFARPWRRLFLTKAIPPRPQAVPMRKRSVAEIKRLVHLPDSAQAPDRRFSNAECHHLHDYLRVVAALGANSDPTPPRIHVTPCEVDSVAERFGLAGPESIGSPRLGLFPGAEYGPAKRWPRERFIEAAIQIQRESRCRWLVFGGPAEASLCQQITDEIQRAANKLSPSINSVTNLAGRTSLRELCAAFKLCRVVLTNDSGPMHVAAAVATPVVVPFGSTSSELTGPGLPGEDRHRILQSRVPCSPCFLRDCPIDFRCMMNISVKQVVAAVSELLARAG